MEHDWIDIVMYIVFFGVMIWAGLSWTPPTCDHYKNKEIGHVPVRCIDYFIKND